MKLHKINNKRNERLFKRLTESCGCAVTEETIDEGPFDAVKRAADFAGNLKDKVTGKKRGTAVGGKGFSAHGESQEDGYDQKIFAAWAAKSNAIADVYNKLVDQNGKVFKLLMKKSLDFNSVKPFDLEKLFIDEMKKDVRLRRVMKAWAKGEDDRAFNILSKQQLKKLNSVLNSGKHGFSGDKAIGTVFYRSLEEVLDSLMEFVGDLDYQDYLGNKFLRGQLRTTVKRMLSPKAGRSGERAWKEFTAGAHFDSDGTRNSLRDAANAAAFAAETIAETVDEERSNGEEASINERNVRTNEKNNVKYNKLYENWNRHLEEELEEELETVVSEDSEGDAAIVNLLSQISQKLDGLEDIDTSIDYLIGALSGETALSAKMKQSTLGRFADASPQLAELIKARGLSEKEGGGRDDWENENLRLAIDEWQAAKKELIGVVKAVKALKGGPSSYSAGIGGDGSGGGSFNLKTSKATVTVDGKQVKLDKKELENLDQHLRVKMNKLRDEANDMYKNLRSKVSTNRKHEDLPNMPHMPVSGDQSRVSNNPHYKPQGTKFRN